jgi:hypothetical protein
MSFCKSRKATNTEGYLLKNPWASFENIQEAHELCHTFEVANGFSVGIRLLCHPSYMYRTGDVLISHPPIG